MSRSPSTGGMVWRDRPVAPAIRRLGTGTSRLAVLEMAAVIAAGSEAPVLLLDPACHAAIAAHLATAPVELGGLLVGTAWSLAPECPEEPPVLLRVEEAVPSLDADSTAISLRMDVELWSRAQAVAARRGALIIGWYHSHPDLGAFFSGTDRQTQAAVFRHPYSLGLVMDPVRGEERWFLGPDCREIHRSGEFAGVPSSLEETAKEGEQS